MATRIEWTDETWNPVTGCSRVSPGCDNCYMFALYPRLREMHVPGYQHAPDYVNMLPGRLRDPMRWKKPKRVFVNSMSDTFHREVPTDFINAMFETMLAAQESGHIFQVLTKRPGRAAAWWAQHGRGIMGNWPRNIWLGTSVESQKYAPRLDVLGRVPAPVRFVSAEPLLSELDLSKWLNNGSLHWVIVGGESGRSARPIRLEWVERIVEECRLTGVPVFVKQLGSGWSKLHAGTEAKGGDWSLWPQSLRVREYPILAKVPTEDQSVGVPALAD